MTTVGALWEKYGPLVIERVSPGTARGYISAWNRRVGPSFGDRHIEQITTLDIELEMARWSGAYSTKTDALAALSQLCKTAIKAQIITVNPCLGVERPRVQENDPTSRALAPGEVGRLLEVLPKDGPYRRFVLAMLFTGCRLGEVAGMRVSDIDWMAGTISVRRTASAGLHGELRIGPTKGRRVRSVPIPDLFVPLAMEASDGKSEHAPLFPGPRGGYINSKNLSRALHWPEIRESIKTFPPGEPKLHFHDLRHTAAVNAFLAGLSAPDVQAILGHSSLQVTQLYANTRHEAAKRATAAFSAFYASRSKGQLPEGGEAAKSLQLQGS